MLQFVARQSPNVNTSTIIEVVCFNYKRIKLGGGQAVA
jgi:hypothetical protein